MLHIFFVQCFRGLKVLLLQASAPLLFCDHLVKVFIGDVLTSRVDGHGNRLELFSDVLTVIHVNECMEHRMIIDMVIDFAVFAFFS